MAPSVYLVGSDGITTVHLVNAAGTPTAGGDPSDATTTPFGVRSDWTPAAAKRLDSYVDETIPLYYVGSDADTARTHLTLLRDLISDPLGGAAALVCQADGATTADSYGLYWIDQVQATAVPSTEYGPGEGALAFQIDLAIRRTPTPGTTIFDALL